MENKIIVSMDTNDFDKVKEVTGAMMERGIEWVKLGIPALSSNHLQHYLRDQHRRIFLDLKLHDIPSTVGRTIRSLQYDNVEMLTLHVSGGFDMMVSARTAADSFDNPPLLLGVTMLTSISEYDYNRMFSSIRGLTEQVVLLARQAQLAGLDGVVASVQEIEAIRKACGEDFLIVTPGIRAENIWKDQRRKITAREAFRRGADYIVAGRAILDAECPGKAIDAIINASDSASAPVQS